MYRRGRRIVLQRGIGECELTMFILAIARHALKGLSGATQRLVLVAIVKYFIKRLSSLLRSDGKMANELNDGRDFLVRFYWCRNGWGGRFGRGLWVGGGWGRQ